MAFDRLVRFIPRRQFARPLIGQPVDRLIDVGKAVYEGKAVEVRAFSGTSVLNSGSPTDQIETIDRILSPLSADEVGTIRCIGLNYANHAKEADVEVPDIPMMFMKPATALADPWPVPTVIPKHTLRDDCADYEAELAIVIGKPCKNVSEAEAPGYILGYTAANDVSSRASQFSQSQVCYSKGFDGSCPLGPILVSAAVMPDPGAFTIRGLRNGEEMQNSAVSDMIFNCAKLVSFLSEGTTLPPGTVIITGTPAGVGLGKKPPAYLKDKDEYVVELLPHVGSLYSVFEAEK
ncbi:uncharacterized protein GGS22DRAFT_10680 [Annulohypoxylon maeteangense]|uniref:uncharacterized protein n=1 Tax=Annulohypoxylon maeteangense TaxID=1927788 RepID=UPI0020086332|nr:uncharacterized protein GGS22DRAFT_10680 [Annulohypoxylon maeteangense]KAI0890241.1 hypothetical protein GGS22DRAFT_10680 [Annulohypoxylon maeteangense]